MPEQDSQAHSELATFGEELRREREIRGISLKEIADSTKVSKRFLEAIERNDHRTLPAPVFTRGFVREYARYLGLNIDEIVNRYNFAAAGDDRIEQSDHLDRLAHVTPDPLLPAGEPRPRARREIPPIYSRVDTNVVVLVVIAAALGALIYWAVDHKRSTRADDSTRPVASGSTRVPHAVPAAPAARTTTAAATGSLPLHLVIDFTGSSVIKLDADGKQVLNDEVKKGEKRTFEAKDTFLFRTIGNAGGVDLTLNGVHLPASGAEGEVVRGRLINRESLQQPAGAADAVRTGT